MPPQQVTPNPILDPLDISPLAKPFKNPYWKAPVRRNKNLKQILQEDVRAAAATTIATSTPLPPPHHHHSHQTTSTNPINTPAADPTLASPKPSLVGATYTNIESAPSFHPARAHWCDITGQPGKYIDPKTKLRYADMEIYKAITNLPPGSADGYLELRGANVVLK